MVGAEIGTDIPKTDHGIVSNTAYCLDDLLSNIGYKNSAIDIGAKPPITRRRTRMTESKYCQNLAEQSSNEITLAAHEKMAVASTNTVSRGPSPICW